MAENKGVKNSIWISLAGVGGINTLADLIKSKPERVAEDIKAIAKSLAEHRTNIIVLTGTEIETANYFKLFGGGKVVAPLPIGDKSIGIKHIRRYMEMKIKRFPLFDGFIDTGDWFKTDFIRPLLGDVLLILGYSPGTLLELNAGLYMYKVKTKKKKETTLKLDGDLENKIRAGTKFPFEVWVYLPFVSGKLPKEIEAYCERIGVRLVYIKDPDDLNRNLERVIKLAERQNAKK